MAVTIQDPLSALVFFFVAVILVILGTYLLFITGITAMLKLLKKNKRFYYKTNHFTALSGMLFRMKQNAAGLASICVLFTALLVTVSTTFSLYTSMDGLLRARYPRNVLVSVYDANQEAKDMVRSAVNQKSQELGLALENVVDREGWNITTARGGRHPPHPGGPFGGLRRGEYLHAKGVPALLRPGGGFGGKPGAALRPGKHLPRGGHPAHRR